jgi:hypothetical protein
VYKYSVFNAENAISSRAPSAGLGDFSLFAAHLLSATARKTPDARSINVA